VVEGGEIDVVHRVRHGRGDQLRHRG
jgi:hypothetical protein